MNIKVKAEVTKFFELDFGDSENLKNCRLFLNCTMIDLQDSVRPNPEICLDRTNPKCIANFTLYFNY